MKKLFNVLTLTALLIFSLVQIFDLKMVDVYDFITITYAEEFLKNYTRTDHTTKEGCQKLLYFGIAAEGYSIMHHNHNFKALDIFTGVENECKEIIEDYQKTQRAKIPTI